MQKVGHQAPGNQPFGVHKLGAKIQREHRLLVRQLSDDLIHLEHLAALRIGTLAPGEDRQ